MQGLLSPGFTYMNLEFKPLEQQYPLYILNSQPQTDLSFEY